MAQSNVYSLNIVGYVNVPVPAGFSILANPLDDGLSDTNVITTVLATNIVANSQVFTFTPSGGYNSTVESYFADFGWFPGTTHLAPGTGFFFFSPTATNITFVGQISAGTYTNTLAANSFNLVGSVVPEALPPGVPGESSTLGVPVTANDVIYRYNSTAYAAEGGYDTITYFQGFGWFDSVAGGGSTNGPTLNVGEGVFLFSTAGGNWVENFSVN